MKKNVFRVLAMLLIGFVSFTACDDDDPIVLPPDNPTGDKVELDNGFYVYSGDIDKLADIPANGIMLATKNENGQVDRASLMETYYMVDAANGFYIIEVSNGNVDYVGSSDAAKVEAVAEEPTAGLYKGTTNSDSVAYTVEESGAYHIVFDSELEMVTYAKADWGIIGAASPNGWDGNTAFPYKESDATKIVWEGTDIAMKTGGFKLRYADGWKIFFNDTEDVRVNTNLGGGMDALTPGGADMNWTEPGIYTITLTYTFGTGFTSVTELTGTAEVTDWSAVKFDVFGTGVAETNTNAIADASSWGWGFAVSADNTGLPTKDGLVYTYTWTNVTLNSAEGEGFGLRSVIGEAFNGSVYRYSVIDSLRSDLTSAVPTTNGFGDVNLNVAETGSYDVYLVIDAGNKDLAKVTIVKNGAYFGDFWTIIGSATPKGWNDNQMIPNADGTEWTWTGNLVAGEFKFRKNADWAEQIGYKADDQSWYFDGNASAYVIAEGEEGTYTVVLTSATPSATVTKN
ncbi:MAG: SusF/SusE family outer membrane protein [Salinivirgaceae bacterium]